MSNFLRDNIKHIAFLWILFFCFVVGPQVSALSFVDYFDLPANACSTSTFSESQMIYQSAGIFSNSNASSTWTNYPSFVVSNSAPNYRFNSPCNYAGSRPGGVSFLKPSKSNDIMTIGLYNYEGGYKNVVIPKSGYSHTMKNGEIVNFDNIYLGHGFIVLYTSNYSHTLQFFSDYYLEDYILFTDPLQSSLTNSSVDNFFLISFPKKKAWSFKLLEMHIDSLFKGNLGSYSVNTFPFTKSYTLTPNLGASPFPTFSSYMSASVSNWHNINGERFYNDTGFIYSEDFEFQAPDFGGNNQDSSGSYVSSDLSAWNDYQSCERETSFKNFIVNAWGMCRDDYKNGSQDYSGFRAVNDFIQLGNIWNENLTGELDDYFSGIDLSYGCQALLNNSISLVKLYNIIGNDPEYYFNVMNELKYITSDNPYNITAICGNRPEIPTEYNPISNSSNVCNMDSWANIVNCLGFGSSESSSGSTYFTSTIDNVKVMVGSVFDSEFINPLIENYNSGFNYISNYSSSSCPDGYSSPFPSSMGDFILYGIVALLILLTSF